MQWISGTLSTYTGSLYVSLLREGVLRANKNVNVRSTLKPFLGLSIGT